MADGQRAHRTLLLKAPIGLRAPNIWKMPHEFPGVFQALLHHGRGLGHTELEEAAVAVSRRPLGSCWFRPDKVTAPGCREFGTKLLMSAAHCSGSIPLKELPIGSAAAPSLGITSFEAASTLPNLPCKRVPKRAAVATHCQGIGPRLPQLNRDSYTNATAGL